MQLQPLVELGAGLLAVAPPGDDDEDGEVDDDDEDDDEDEELLPVLPQESNPNSNATPNSLSQNTDRIARSVC